MGRWLEDAVGGMGWRPEDFWEATTAEYLAALRGFNRANSPSSPKMTREEFEDLEERYLKRG